MSLPSALASGTLYTSAGEGRMSHVAHCRLRPRGGGGPEPAFGQRNLHPDRAGSFHTTAQIAALASEVTGKPLAVVNLSDEQLAGGMKAAGVPDMLIPMLVSFRYHQPQGGFDVVTGDVERLTGQTPQTLRAFFEANKAAL